MCITIPAWIAMPLIQEGKINPIEAFPFLVVYLIGLVLMGKFYGNVQEQNAR